MGLARENEIQNVVREILADYTRDRAIDQQDVSTEVDEDAVINIVQQLLRILFPGYYLSLIHI